MHQPGYCFADDEIRLDPDRHCADCGIPFDQDIIKFVIARGAVQTFVCEVHYEMRLWREERVRG